MDNGSRAVKLENTWEAFLPIDSSRPVRIVLFGLLKHEVAPLIRELKSVGLTWFSLLIHDRESGVPTTADDLGEYIHLRLAFMRAESIELPPAWMFVRRGVFGSPVGARAAFIRGGADAAWELLGRQSQWFLDLVESIDAPDDHATADLVAQFLHYFANMAQMNVT